MLLCDKRECTGCAACLNACSQNCITMEQTKQGFYYPCVDEAKCLHCNACQQACPQMRKRKNNVEESTPLIYAAQMQNKDKELKESSSGGVAYALSEYVLQQGGIVFGAAYQDGMHVKHIMVDNIEDLAYLQGSKYVQSEIGETYRNVKNKLKNGIPVLFIGVPCQVAGLFQYLGEKRYPNLLTCDLLCAGATSPGVFDHYVRMLERKYETEFTDYCFRDKQHGYGLYVCSVKDKAGVKQFIRGADAGFSRTMGAGYIRESCFSCRYADIHRIGDISLGDFSLNTEETKKYSKGISFIFANTKYGRQAISELSKDMLWIQTRTAEEAYTDRGCSINGGRKKPITYDSFFEDVFKMPWDAVYRKYLRSGSWKMEIVDSLPVCMAVFLHRIKRRMSPNGK